VEPFVLRDGYLDLPAGPGLGIERTEDIAVRTAGGR
jgi:hypothetical protein